MDESWTIVELAELAAEILARPADGGPVQANGRVREVPNERLIRWYGTVGLVDPPLSRRGRVARYGRRHLLQLVAVKRRQAEGKSLAEIQAELVGVPDETLAAVARMRQSPAGESPDGGSTTTEPRPAPGRFWARDPQPLAAAFTARAEPLTAEAGLDAAGVPPVTVDDITERAGVGPVYGIRLAPGVVLLLDGADRQLGPDDMTGIANAAVPLLAELASRGLGTPSPRHSAEMDHPQTGAGNEH